MGEIYKIHDGRTFSYFTSTSDDDAVYRALNAGYIVSTCRDNDLSKGYYIEENGVINFYENCRFQYKLMDQSRFEGTRSVYKCTSNNIKNETKPMSKSYMLHDGRIAKYLTTISTNENAYYALSKGHIVGCYGCDSLADGYYIKDGNAIVQFKNGKSVGDLLPDFKFHGKREVYIIESNNIKQENNKGVKTMKESIMQYVKEHKTIIITVVLVILVDKLVFKGAFTERLKNIVDKFLGTAEAQLEKKA